MAFPSDRRRTRPYPTAASPLVRPPLVPRTLRPTLQPLGRAQPLTTTPPILPRAIAENAPTVDLAAALDRKQAGGAELVLARRNRAAVPAATSSKGAPAPDGAGGMSDAEWYERMTGYLRAKTGQPAPTPKPSVPPPAKPRETDAEWYERMREALKTKRDRVLAEQQAAAERLAQQMQPSEPAPEPDPDVAEAAREAAREAAFRRAALGSVALARFVRSHDVPGPSVAPAPEPATDAPLPANESPDAATGSALEGGRGDGGTDVSKSDASPDVGAAVPPPAFQDGGDAPLHGGPDAPARAGDAIDSPEGLTVGEHVREYAAADGGEVTRDDRARLDAIGARAVAICERELGPLLSVATRRMIDLVQVDVDLDLTRMTDEEAAEVWGRELAKAVRARLRRPGA